MDRRTFVRVIGGVGLTSLMDPGYSLFGAGASRRSPTDQEGVLVEACRFRERGGWVLDTQHYQQMGGCYLLAHGMGKPVANARTQVGLPSAGKWRVFVRTRNWCPGDWRPPGRFVIQVGGTRLEPEMGGGSDEWHWQEAGTYIAETAGEIELAVVDLTGFDGRFDAIYLTQSQHVDLPNADLVELTGWKDRLSGRASEEVATSDFDLVVVGGGISGCAAALAAKSQGLKVALIQDRPLFGGNASEEVRVHTIGIHGQGKRLLEQIDTPHYPNGHADATIAQEKREATLMRSGVSLYPGHLGIGLEKLGSRIVSVDAREATSGRIRRFRAPVFVDATGDGWLGFWAGAAYRSGRESHREFGEEWKQHGDLWSPEVADNRVLGTSVLWNSERTGKRSEFPEVPWAMPVSKRHSAIAGEWYWEYSRNDLDQIEDAELIRDHLLRAIYGSFANAKKDPKNADVELKWVSFIGGKRESRRLMGDYIYTMRDMTERRNFEDAVVEEVREVDAHYQRSLKGASEDFLSTALFMKTGGKYFIPFRCLYSRNIANLMMAGRCFSCSHIGLCGPRVMLTCGQMGIATGYAASLCKKYSASPRDVGQNYIQELRGLIGYQSLDG